MIIKMFTIYDEKAHAYLPPFFLPQSDVAMRTFADCVNSDSHQFGAHPHDYTLFELGTWDDESAVVTLHGRSKTLGNGVEFKILPPTDPSNEPDETPAFSNEAPILSGPQSGNTPL